MAALDGHRPAPPRPLLGRGGRSDFLPLLFLVMVVDVLVIINDKFQQSVPQFLFTH